MTTSKALCSVGLAAGVGYIATSYEASYAFDRPLLTLIVLLASAGQSLVFFSKFILFPEQDTDSPGYSAVPDDEGESYELRSPSKLQRYPDEAPTSDGTSPAKLGSRGAFLSLIVALCVRTDTARRIINDSQCSQEGWFHFIPLALAVYDYFTFKRNEPSKLDDVDIDASVADAIGHNLLHNGVRYVFVALALGLSSLASVTSSAVPRSSYVCAPTLPVAWWIPVIQVFAFVLDVGILMIIARLLKQGTRRAVVWIGAALLASAAVSASMGVLVALFQGTLFWISLEGNYVWSVIGLAVATSLVMQCALRLICYVGSLTTSMFLVVCWSYSLTLVSAWINVTPFPPLSHSVIIICASAMVLCFYFYFVCESESEDSNHSGRPPAFHSVPVWMKMGTVGLLLLQIVVWIPKTRTVRYHPIDAMMQFGVGQHDEWAQLADGPSIQSVARDYRIRHHRNPPPRFDAWYEFAVNRSSAIMNRYDTIQDDLAMFWTVPPTKVRERTAELLEIPNDIGGIRIRGGSLTILSKNEKQHTILERISRMMESFVHHLPDMDIAFNTEAYGRVLIQHEDEENRRNIERVNANSPEKPYDFKQNRAAGWDFDFSKRPPKSHFHQYSDSNSFDQFAAYSCPEDSKARSERQWKRGRLCASCAIPHSLGQFLSDTTAASSICHQPDLAHLHGFYQPPNPVRITHDLLPLFSIRKAPGFSDILFPSPEDYERAGAFEDGKPDTGFDKTKEKLFWRGSASEGFSGQGGWKGMTPQRLDHLANADTAPHVVLLSHTKFVQGLRKRLRLSYTTLSADQIKRQIPRDVHLSAINPDSGVDEDVSEQTFAFQMEKPKALKEHLQHRYLLSLDDDMSSSRFLDYVASRSVALRASIFRSWYDERLKPWVHYVPIDIRLHGLWSTIGYFRGLSSDSDEWPAHKREARLIAEGGRGWAQQTLRKEDMEIYLFRLLLEWGRVTDNERDKLGYLPDG